MRPLTRATLAVITLGAEPTLTRSILAFLLAFWAACDPGTELEQSCRGEAVPNCLPYELAQITSVEVGPSGVRVGDPAARVMFRVAFDRCPGLDRHHEVTVQLRDGEQLQDLLTLADDGRDGDAMAGDGLIEKEVGNPFIGPMIPSSRTVELRFQTRVPPRCSPDRPDCVGGTCRSEVYTQPYVLGPRFMAM